MGVDGIADTVVRSGWRRRGGLDRIRSKLSWQDGVSPLELPLVGPVEADQVHVLVTGSVYLAGDVLSVSF